MGKNPTQNHDLPKPIPGDFDGSWGTDVMNDDMTQKLEERLVARDTEANLSNYEPYDRAIFIAEDTGAVYDGDGSQWIKAKREFSAISSDSISTTDAEIDRLIQNLDLDLNELSSVNAIKFRSGSDRVVYGGNAGLFIKRSFGEDATITKQWSPPESQGGKESTYALVVGDNDDYVYDMYNNAGYTSGGRAAQWGVSLKHQSEATATPFVIDFDNEAIGGNSNTRRFVINPLGELELLNGPVNISTNAIYGLREVGSTPSSDDLNEQEWAFSKDRDGAGTAAWLFKDSEGTTHYWDADGTL